MAIDRGIAVCNVDKAGGFIRPLQDLVWVTDWLQADNGEPLQDDIGDALLDEGNPVAIVGCPVDPHGPPPHDSAVMVEGEKWIDIEHGGANIKVCFLGHRASCGCAATGREFIGIDD